MDGGKETSEEDFLPKATETLTQPAGTIEKLCKYTVV